MIEKRWRIFRIIENKWKWITDAPNAPHDLKIVLKKNLLSSYCYYIMIILWAIITN